MRTPNRLEVHRPEKRPANRKRHTLPQLLWILWIVVVILASFFVAERFGGRGAAEGFVLVVALLSLGASAAWRTWRSDRAEARAAREKKRYDTFVEPKTPAPTVQERRLQNMKNLYDAGLLTREEYDEEVRRAGG